MNIVFSDNVSVKTVGEEVFIYDSKSSEIHTFNPTGNFILKNIIEKKPLNEIPKMMEKEFSVEYNSSKKDLDEFIKSLIDKNIVKEK